MKFRIAQPAQPLIESTAQHSVSLYNIESIAHYGTALFCKNSTAWNARHITEQPVGFVLEAKH